MSGFFDKVADFGMRYETLLSIIGGIWLAASWAVYARFVSLPDIPFLTDQTAIFLSSGYNAFWWGFLRPKIEKRKAAHRVQNGVEGEQKHD
ncbi:MAG: hypothetical protein V3V15_02710 [Sphingorhabdus sp.]